MKRASGLRLSAIDFVDVFTMVEGAQQRRIESLQQVGQRFVGVALQDCVHGVVVGRDSGAGPVLSVIAEMLNPTGC